MFSQLLIIITRSLPIFIFAFLSCNGWTQSEIKTEALARPKICLVLSGGGARGAAHVGVLKVLEALHIPIDCIAGTSMGALVGAAYASGTPIKEIEERLTEADWDDLLTDTSPRADRSFLRKEEDQVRLLKLEIGVKDGTLYLPPGAISGQKLDVLFSKITRYSQSVSDFDKLPIPFRAVATDGETGHMVVFDQGRLTDVMRASMSVPGAIAPYQTSERVFFDGGLTRNLPVDVARQMGATIVIAVNLGTPLLKRSELRSIVDISLQMINILTEQNVGASLAALKPNDILISPPLETISAGDFFRISEAIAIGEKAAREMSTTLSQYSLPPMVYSAWQTNIAQRALPDGQVDQPIDEIRIAGAEKINHDSIRRALDIQPGEKVDYPRINEGISRVFGLGYFERVNYSLLSENSRQILTVNAREKPWGPNYLRFALNMSADSTAEGRFNLLMRYQQTQLNEAGAEWHHSLQIGRDRRLATQFYQPLWNDSLFSIRPGIEISRRPIDVYDSGRRFGQYEIASSTIGTDLGINLGRNAIATLGVTRGNAKAKANIGFLLPERQTKYGAVRLRSVFDNLNDLSFPRSGRTLSLDYYANLKSLSASNAYQKLELNYADHYSWGAHTFALAGRYGKSWRKEDEPLPVFDQFSLGGFLQLSGYRPGELLGESISFGRLSYYRKIGDLQNPLGRSLYLGFSAEMGRVSENFQSLSGTNSKNSLSIFAGFDTFLGPLYLGYGRTKERSTMFYFFLGQP